MSDFKYAFFGVFLAVGVIFASLEFGAYFQNAIVKKEVIKHSFATALRAATSTQSTSTNTYTIPENWIADRSNAFGIAFAYPSEFGDITEVQEECMMDTEEQLKEEQKKHPNEPCRVRVLQAKGKSFVVSQTQLYAAHPTEHDTYFGDLSSRVQNEVSVRRYCGTYSANIETCQVFRNKNNVFIAHSTEKIGEEEKFSDVYHIYTPSKYYKGVVFDLNIFNKEDKQKFLDTLRYIEPQKEYKKMNPSIKPLPEEYFTKGLYHDDVCGFEFQYPPKLAEDPVGANVFFIDGGEEEKPAMILYTHVPNKNAHKVNTSKIARTITPLSIATTSSSTLPSFSPVGRFNVLKSTKLTEYDKPVYTDELGDNKNEYKGFLRLSLPCAEKHETNLIIGYGKEKYFEKEKDAREFVSDILSTLFLFDPLTAQDEADMNILHSENMKPINVFLFNEIKNDEGVVENITNGCIYPVVRYIEEGKELSVEELRDALKVLIKGVTRAEKREGYKACFARKETFGHQYRGKIDIDTWQMTLDGKGAVTIDIPIKKDALWCSGNATHRFMLQSSITNTLTQFNDINKVIFMSNGKLCSEIE